MRIKKSWLRRLAVIVAAALEKWATKPKRRTP